MNKDKKHLNMLNSLDNTMSCFSLQKQHNVDCKRCHCNHWIDSPEYHNCVLIAAQEGPHTLQKIGQMYGLTRMRICQIEKTIFEKIKNVS